MSCQRTSAANVSFQPKRHSSGLPNLFLPPATASVLSTSNSLLIWSTNQPQGVSPRLFSHGFCGAKRTLTRSDCSIQPAANPSQIQRGDRAADEMPHRKKPVFLAIPGAFNVIRTCSPDVLISPLNAMFSVQRTQTSSVSGTVRHIRIRWATSLARILSFTLERCASTVLTRIPR